MNLSTFQYIFSSIFNIHQKKGGRDNRNEVTVSDISILLQMLEDSGFFLIYFSTSPRHFEQYFFNIHQKKTQRKK